MCLILKDVCLQLEHIGLGLISTDRLWMLESTDKWSNALLALVFSRDLLAVTKI